MGAENRLSVTFVGVGEAFLGLRWSFAETGHSSPCLALRLAHNQSALEGIRAFLPEPGDRIEI